MNDTLYLLNSDMRLNLASGQLIVSQQEQILGRHPLEATRAVLVFGNPQITTQAIKACFEHGIDIQYYSARGRYLGIAMSTTPKDTTRRLAQYALLSHEDIRLNWCKALIQAKLHTYLLQYRRLRDNGWITTDGHYPALLREQTAQALHADSLEELRGCEGIAARDYFEFFAQALPAGWNWQGRHYHPAPDPVNALLSLNYSMVKQLLDAAARQHGYDPTLPFMHRHGYGSAGLSADLIELMRAAICDHAVLKILRAEKITSADFTEAQGIVKFTNRGYQHFFQLFDQMVKPQVKSFSEQLFSCLNHAFQAIEQTPDFLQLFPLR